MANQDCATLVLNPEIARELEILRADYQRVRGEPFEAFFCPILLEDRPVKLCMGHVINQSFPNCCRKWVVQRTDVDGFFGSLFESKFSAILNAKPNNVHDAITDEKLRRLIPFDVKLDGTVVQHYVVKEHKASSDPLVSFRDSDGKVLNLALKVSSTEKLSNAGRLEIEMDCNITPEATATLLKAAHLTLFKLLGYDHAFSAGGYDLAKILQQFYLNNFALSRTKQVQNGKEYFTKFAGMVVPVKGFNPNIVKGTVEDGRLLACIGTSGAWFAVGVLIRIDSRMFVVLHAPDNAHVMDTYKEFVSTTSKRKFRYKLIEFSPANETEGAHWTMDTSEPFMFDPDCDTGNDDRNGAPHG